MFEHQGEHDSQWAAIGSIAAKIGCTVETLLKWARQADLARAIFRLGISWVSDFDPLHKVGPLLLNFYKSFLDRARLRRYVNNKRIHSAC